jgi:hypothetical protein
MDCAISSIITDLASQTRRPTTSAEALETAILLAREMLAEAPADHVVSPSGFHGLAVLLERKYHRHSHNLDDLQEAITWGEQAELTAPEGHPDLLRYLSGLSGLLLDRYERIGDREDLQQVIEMVATVLDVSEGMDRGVEDEIHESMVRRLNIIMRKAGMTQAHARIVRGLGRLGGMEVMGGISVEVIGSGAQDYLDESILAAENFRSRVPPGLLTPEFLANLGVKFAERSNRTESLDDIDAAINYGEQAATMGTACQHPESAVFHMNLAGFLARRYTLTGRLEDLDKAILRGGEAVKMAPRGHPSRGNMLSNLAYNTYEIQNNRGS